MAYPARRRTVLRSAASSAIAAGASGFLAEEMVSVTILGKGRGETVEGDTGEHPRADTMIEGLAKLKPLFGEGTVTAGNAAGINDGAAAMIIASEAAAKAHGLTPRARIMGGANASIEPRVMGIDPVPATQKLKACLGLTIGDLDALELNEAFARPSLAVMCALGLPADAPPCEREWRRHRGWLPARHVGRANRDDARAPAGENGGAKLDHGGGGEVLLRAA